VNQLASIVVGRKVDALDGCFGAIRPPCAVGDVGEVVGEDQTKGGRAQTRKTGERR
jgi:hypothetical protein